MEWHCSGTVSAAWDREGVWESKAQVVLGLAHSKLHMLTVLMKTQVCAVHPVYCSTVAKPGWGWGLPGNSGEADAIVKAILPCIILNNTDHRKRKCSSGKYPCDLLDIVRGSRILILRASQYKLSGPCSLECTLTQLCYVCFGFSPW